MQLCPNSYPHNQGSFHVTLMSSIICFRMWPSLMKASRKHKPVSMLTLMRANCKGNSQIPIFWLRDSCNSLQFLWLCVIIHLKSRTKSQHPLITQYMSHIVYPYHVVPLSIYVPCYCHPIPSPSCFTYYFQYFLYFISSPYLTSMIHCWLLCTLFLM